MRLRQALGMTMIELDGSMGEGGGQVFRSALTLALLTGKSFRIRNIRARRKPKPGLQAQHLASFRAAAAISSARISGDAVGSSVATFEPGPVVSGNYRFPIGTAGATGLVLHTVYLPLACRGSHSSEIILEGGTHVPNSPCFHFLKTTWRAHMLRLGLKVDLEMLRPGFYPRGGGQIIARTEPCKLLKPVLLARSQTVYRATGFSAVAGLPSHIATRQAKRASARLEAVGIDANFELQEWRGGPGSVLGIVFDETPVPTFFFGLGERGKPAEAVADAAVDEAIAFAHANAPVDTHSADQLVLPLALAEGESEFYVSQITRHLITNIAVIRIFIDRPIECTGAEGAAGVVRILSA